MRNLLFGVLCILGLGLYSCSKSSSGGTPVAKKINDLTVTLSQDTLQGNGWAVDQITVWDSLGRNVTSSSHITIDTTLTDSIFTSTSVGTHTITATVGLNYGTATLVVVNPSSTSAFTKKLLIEDFSGTWCGFCPRMGYELDQYTATQPKAAWITVHGYVGSGDPFVYQYESNLETVYNITGFPTGIVDGYLTWDENNSTLNNEYSKYTPLGLSVQSSTSGKTITGTVQVKFSINLIRPLKIVVALVENGLTYNQDNYYSATGGQTPYLYGGADPIVNFTEKNVLRSTSTNYLGDSIPVTAETSGNIYSLPFSFSTSGVTGDGASFTVVPANCKIVAYVVDGTGTFNGNNTLGVINVQQAAVGNTQPFD
jgi:thiol-disulfide isomerase/thioredoxin